MSDQFTVADLAAAPCYPLNLNGPLCPMLSDPETLAAIYDVKEAR